MVFSSNELDLLVLQNGKDGVSADSKYTWVKYSQNADGNPMTDNPEGAVYIGIAYNKNSVTESDNPTDYDWTKIAGDAGADAYTILLSNENISFVVDYDTHLSATDQEFECNIRIFQGVNERTDFTIGEITSQEISVSKNDTLITLSVSEGDSLEEPNGTVRIPINIDGLVFYKDIAWNRVLHGKEGENGSPAISIFMGNESQNIPCGNDGTALQNFLIEIPFSGYKGTEKIPCSVSVGVLPSGVTLGGNVPSTATSDGMVTLNVAQHATFGGADILNGTVIFTFSIDGIQMIRYFSWVKTRDGADGQDGTMTLYEVQYSTPVLNKTYDDGFSPESVIFSAYTRTSTDSEKVSYSGRFVISESTNNQTYSTKYTSSSDESSVSYSPSSISVTSIRCILYQAGGITSQLDVVTIPILSDIDNIKPVIEEIQTSISGVESEVDAVNKKITDKVWQSDVTTAINNYDNTTVKTIRDNVASHTTQLGNITSEVSDIQTTLTTKADGSTVSELSEKVSTMEQDAESFKVTVSETYETKENASAQYAELSAEADEIRLTVEEAVEEVRADLTVRADEIEAQVETNTGNISSVTQTANAVKTEVENARGENSSLAVRFDGIESTVENNTGAISDISQRADQIESTVSLKKDCDLSNIRYVRDWLNSNDANVQNRWTNCQVWGENTDYAEGITPTGYTNFYSPTSISVTNGSYYTSKTTLEGNNYTTQYATVTSSDWTCLQIDLGEIKKVEYLTVWHFFSEEYSYNHKLQVSRDGTTWFTLYDSEITGQYMETADGSTYVLDDNYVADTFSRITQDYNSIRSIVTDNETMIKEWDNIVDAMQNDIKDNSDAISSSGDTILDINNNLNNLIGSYTETQNTVNSISQTVASFDGTYATKSEIEQNDREWKIRFAQIGMYDGTDIEHVETNFTVSSAGAIVNNNLGQETHMTVDGLYGKYNGEVIFQVTQDLTITKRLQSENGIDCLTIKLVPKNYTINSVSYGALLHVKSGGSS